MKEAFLELIALKMYARSYKNLKVEFKIEVLNKYIDILLKTTGL